MSGIIKSLKEKYGWENYLVFVHDIEKFSEFKKYKTVELYKRNYFIVPIEKMNDISYEKDLERDFSITYWDEIGKDYKKNYRRYEFMFWNGWWKIAYTVYEKINWWKINYRKFIDLFDKYMKEFDDFDIAWHTAFNEVMK